MGNSGSYYHYYPFLHYYYYNLNIILKHIHLIFSGNNSSGGMGNSGSNGLWELIIPVKHKRNNINSGRNRGKNNKSSTSSKTNNIST